MPASTPAPHAFSSEAGKDVCEKYTGSVPCYEGPLFDAHLHINVAGLSSDSPTLNSLLDRDGVALALGFFDTTGADASVARVKDLAAGSLARVVPLIQPSHSASIYLGGFTAPAGIKDVFVRLLQPEEPFAGVGEIALYFPSLALLTLESHEIAEMLAAIDEVGGVAMIHPRDTHTQGMPTTREEIGAVVRDHPNITFVFHGHETQGAFDLIEPLMSEYSNVYFSFDFPSWNVYWDGSSQNRPPPCDPCAGVFWGSSQEVAGANELETFHSSLLASGGPVAVATKGAALAAAKIAQHPDRVLWGTDRFRNWHYDVSISQAVVEVSRLLIGALPSDWQEAFAFGNANRLLAAYLDETAVPATPLAGANMPALAVTSGDKLAVPELGIESPLAVYQVTPNGVMPDPEPGRIGLYDFGALGVGYGGVPGVSGNSVFVGHHSITGTPGPFFALGEVSTGQIVEVTYGSTVFKYAVTMYSEVHQTDGDWDAILSATKAESITVISDASPNHRLVVLATRVE